MGLLSTSSSFAMNLELESKDLHTTRQLVYQRGTFKSEKGIDQNGAKFCMSHPQKPTSQHNQSARIYEPEGNFRNVSRNFVPQVSRAIDRRTQIQGTEQWPHSCNVQLRTKFNDDRYIGSGVLVGPHHILRAAHCVYDDHDNGWRYAEWASEVIASVALNNTIQPFGQQKATRLFIPKQWKENHNPDFDMALIILDGPVGHKSGWAGLYSTSSDEYLKTNRVNVMA